MDTNITDSFSNVPEPPVSSNVVVRTQYKSSNICISLKELSPPSSTTSYEDGESCLNDTKTAYMESYTTHGTSLSDKSMPSPKSAKSSTSKTTTNSAREHEKYMRKRLKNKDIREKMKLRIERYTLERDALNLRIKECTNFLNRCICETVDECNGDHE
jgi:hypothetical protein